MVTDKKLNRYLKGIHKAIIMAYSYIATNKFIKDILKEEPIVKRNRFKWNQGMTNTLKDQHNRINLRIDELLEGAEDEY